MIPAPRHVIDGAMFGFALLMSLVPAVGAANLEEATSGWGETTYDEAMATYQAVKANEANLALHESCGSTLLTHGAKAARVVVYFHGFTSCPAQGDELAATLFEMGYNVYLPRMPGHGELVPSAESMAELDAEHLIGLADESLDIAQGLGDEIVVTGLSAGGTLAAWTAQYRADVDHAIMVSPFFGPFVVPSWAMRTATNLTLRAPNLVFPWNPLQNAAQDETAIPEAMPSTHALAEIMLVGWVVRDGAQKAAPAAAKVSLLLNAADFAVSNTMTDEIIAYWRGHGAEVTVETLPFSAFLPHDLINPRQRGGNVELVYPMLIGLLNGNGQR